jgi:hypothetical protein
MMWNQVENIVFKNISATPAPFTLRGGNYGITVRHLRRGIGDPATARAGRVDIRNGRYGFLSGWVRECQSAQRHLSARHCHRDGRLCGYRRERHNAVEDCPVCRKGRTQN